MIYGCSQPRELWFIDLIMYIHVHVHVFFQCVPKQPVLPNSFQGDPYGPGPRPPCGRGRQRTTESGETGGICGGLRGI